MITTKIEPAVTNRDMQPDGTTLHNGWNSVGALDSDGKYVYTLVDGATNGTVQVHSRRLSKPIADGYIFVCIAVLGSNTNAANTTLEYCTKIETRQLDEHTWLFVGESTGSYGKSLNTKNFRSVKILASAMYTREEYEKILSLSLSRCLITQFSTGLRVAANMVVVS